MALDSRPSKPIAPTMNRRAVIATIPGDFVAEQSVGASVNPEARNRPIAVAVPMDDRAELAEPAVIERPALEPAVTAAAVAAEEPHPPAAEVAPHPVKRVDFMGVPLDVLRTEDVLAKIGELCAQNGRVHTLIYLNAHTYCQNFSDPQYHEVVRNADLVYPDGMSIVWGSRIIGRPVPVKLTLSDMIHPIAEYAAKHGMGIYLLGGKPGVAERAANALKVRNPDLKIAGTQDGFFAQAENGTIVESINRAKPHILLVGMGAPYQEKWVGENLDALKVPICIPCGGLFNFLSGDTPRAPHWMSDNGLEWFFRLCVEPRRLWKRYSYENFRFAWSLGRHLLRRSQNPRNDER